MLSVITGYGFGSRNSSIDCKSITKITMLQFPFAKSWILNRIPLDKTHSNIVKTLHHPITRFSSTHLSQRLLLYQLIFGRYFTWISLGENSFLVRKERNHMVLIYVPYGLIFECSVQHDWIWSGSLPYLASSQQCRQFGVILYLWSCVYYGFQRIGLSGSGIISYKRSVSSLLNS